MKFDNNHKNKNLTNSTNPTKNNKPKPLDNSTDSTEKLTIEKLGNDFEGVCYTKQGRCLVKGALPNEVVLADNPRKSGSVTIYNLKKVLKPSPLRVESPCKYQSICGACNLLYVSVEGQHKLKTDLIKRRLNDYRNLVSDIIYKQDSKRNKIQFSFAKAGTDIQIGFFNSDTHKVEDIPECLMHDNEKFQAVRLALKKWCKKYDIIAYNPHRQRGNLRFAVLRVLKDSLAITLVFYKHIDDGLSYLYSLLKESFSFVSLNTNINSEISNAVFSGDPEYCIGEKRIADRICGIDYLYQAGDFLQTNSEICESVYNKVLEIILNSGVKKVVDAYSGIGITTALFAKNGLDVISVEISEKAVETAKKTAKINNVADKITFLSGDFNLALKDVDCDSGSAMFVDPPRAGLGANVCQTILTKAPSTLIYLSCEPKTLAADLKLLSAKYQPTLIQPYDMFPNTNHVECVVLMSRVEK